MENITNIEINRIVELIDKTKIIKQQVINDCYKHIKKDYPSYGTKGKIEKAFKLYQKTYIENLSSEEKTIIALYTIINDDKKLAEEFIRTKSNFSLIGKIYGVSGNFVKLRWEVYRKLKKYDNETKILKLK